MGIGTVFDRCQDSEAGIMCKHFCDSLRLNVSITSFTIQVFQVSAVSFCPHLQILCQKQGNRRVIWYSSSHCLTLNTSSGSEDGE